MPEVLDLHTLFGGNEKAEALARKYEAMRSRRNSGTNSWEEQKKELRNYVFATDTRHTSDVDGDWHNSTTVPKLCQIRDNLHANYRATIFSNSDWLVWEGGDKDSVSQEQRVALQAYIKTKMRDSHFERTTNKLIYDYIDYGNCFAEVLYKRRTYTREDGSTGVSYVGGVLNRIDPMDIVFDVTAPNFENAPKFVREVYNIGELEKIAKEQPDRAFFSKAMSMVEMTRNYSEVLSNEDARKANALNVDGFGNYLEYLNSGMVEILRYEGDYYDAATGLHCNKRVWVIDRMHILHEEEMNDWLPGSRIRHVGWRHRQNNLMAMGPLDNLVGIQYRIDRLQNQKSDIYDLTAAPPLKVRGYVEEFDYAPMERIYTGDDGDVELIPPSVNALNADLEIDWLERKMEEMAGSPRETMGMRTPGEKTAFEMQVLENGAARIFQDKVRNFEMEFLEYLANDYLEQGRRHADLDEVVRDIDPTYGAQAFYNITPELLQTSGKLRAVASRHFAEQARMAQNLTSLVNSGAFADEAIKAHFSPLVIARMFEKAMGLEGDGLVTPNARVMEASETDALAMQAQEENLVAQATPGFEGELPPEEELI